MNTTQVLETIVGFTSAAHRAALILALKVTRGNQSQAAKLLDCNRNTLARDLRTLKINPRDSRDMVLEDLSDLSVMLTKEMQNGLAREASVVSK